MAVIVTDINGKQYRFENRDLDGLLKDIHEAREHGIESSFIFLSDEGIDTPPTVIVQLCHIVSIKEAP